MKLSSINKVDISLKQLLDVDASGGAIDTVDAIRNGQVLTAYVTSERKDKFRFKNFSSFLAAGTGITLTTSNGVTTISSTGGGATTLAALTDVALSSPIIGDVLMYNGTAWYNTPLTGGGDMTKSVYDIDNDGVVDKAETVQIIVRNSTGVTLTKGQVVYLLGATGNRPNAVLSDATTEATSSKTIGLVTADILNNADGYVTISGTMHDLDLSMYSAGDRLWLDTTPGGMVATTPPAEPAHAVFIGTVARAHPTQGRIVLAIQNGYELTELHGVLVPSPSNNDVLRYNSTSGLWEDDSIATILGFTPISLSSLSASSPLSYNSGTGVFSIPAATSSVDGYLTSTDWTTFNNKAPLASPAFTGNPTAPTPSFGDNDTSIATTAFVQAAANTPSLIKVNANLTTAVNSTSLTTLYSFYIPANTVASGDMIHVVGRARKSPIAANGNCSMRIYVNTSATAGGSIVGLLNTGVANNVYMHMRRDISVTNATNSSIVFINTTTAGDDATASNGTSNVLVIDWTVDQYIILGITPGSASDTWYGMGFRAEIKKYNL